MTTDPTTVTTTEENPMDDDIPDDNPTDLIRQLAGSLGITEEEAGGLTRADLEACAAQASAAIDQDEAYAHDLREVRVVMEKYPELVARGLTVGEMVPHMTPGDAALVREIGDRLDAAHHQHTTTAHDVLAAVEQTTRQAADHLRLNGYVGIPYDPDDPDGPGPAPERTVTDAITHLRQLADNPALGDVPAPRMFPTLDDHGHEIYRTEETLTVEQAVAAAAYATVTIALHWEAAQNAMLDALAAVRVATSRNRDDG